MYELLGNIAFYSPLIIYPEKLREAFKKKKKSVDFFFHTGEGGQPQIHIFLKVWIFKGGRGGGAGRGGKNPHFLFFFLKYLIMLIMLIRLELFMNDHNIK